MAQAPNDADAAAAEWKENLNVRLICKDCREDPPNLYEDHASGDLICDSCGLVLGQRTIDMSSEWRTFSNDDQGNDDPSRVGDGPNSLLNGDQLDTQIKFEGGLRNKDLARAQKNSTLDKANVSLMMAYKKIGSYCDHWQLPTSVIDAAKHHYKDAAESKWFKGKNPDMLIAAAIGLACRRGGVHRSFKEVSDLIGLPRKDVGKVFKMLQNFYRENRKRPTTVISGGRVVQNDQYIGSPTANPADLCNRYCNMLNLSQRTSSVAELLAIKMTQHGALDGRSPLSSAAACIFMAGQLMGEPRTYKDIMAVAKVSDTTIRGAYKLLYQEKDVLITEEILNRGADPERLGNPA